MSTPTTPITGVNRRTAFVATAVVIGLVGSGALVWRSTSAAFTANTTSGSNSWATGTVGLTNDGSAGAVFNVSGLVPGAGGAKCITVTYSGNVATSVKLYVPTITDADGLGDHVDLVITPGTADDADCTNFASGGGAMYTGTLAAFGSAHNDYASGVGTWTPNAAAQTKLYKIAYTLASDTPDAHQGDTASVTFKWEAQSGS